MSDLKLNYEDACKELEQIVQDMEKGDISVDELAEKIKRSAVLIRFCKQKLKTTEESVEAILKNLEE